MTNEKACDYMKIFDGKAKLSKDGVYGFVSLSEKSAGCKTSVNIDKLIDLLNLLRSLKKMGFVRAEIRIPENNFPLLIKVRDNEYLALAPDIGEDD